MRKEQRLQQMGEAKIGQNRTNEMHRQEQKRQIILTPRGRGRRFIEMKNLKSNFTDIIILSLVLIISIIITFPPTSSNGAQTANLNNHRHQTLSTEQVMELARQKLPHFVEPESPNNEQKVAVGRPVKFKCVVNNIGDHKIAWFHKDRRLLLAFDNKIVAWKERIHVSSQANSVFFLQIDSVQLSDKGQFTCQLSTQPVQSQVHILDVVQSPQIREQETTVNIEPVKEFGSVELRCAADGVPKPEIKWRRESQMHVIPAYEDSDQQYTSEGDGNEQVGGGEQRGTGDSINTSANKGVQVASQTAHQLLPDVSENELSSDLARQQQQRTRANVVVGNSTAPPFSSSLQPASGEEQRLSSAEAKVKQAVASLDSMEASNSSNSSNYSRNSSFDAKSNNNRSSTMTTNPNKMFIAEGEVLRFDRVSRSDMGFYMCIASNGVSPSVSQRIFLPVSFIPRPTNAPTTITEGRLDERLDRMSTSNVAGSSLSSPNRVEALHESEQSGNQINGGGRTNLSGGNITHAHHGLTPAHRSTGGGKLHRTFQRTVSSNRQQKAARSSASPFAGNALTSSPPSLLLSLWATLWALISIIIAVNCRV